MSDLTLMLYDLAAIGVLVFGVYFPRHRKRTMVVAFLTVNIGVLAVADALLASTVSAGLGLGLFGVLSIIRLRSTELEQHEVAYYFGSLALGLLGGLTQTSGWITPALMALIVTALYVGDHPRLLGSYRSQVVTLDRAFVDEGEVQRHLESLLGARVHRVVIRKTDLVRDITTVEAHFQVGAGERRIDTTQGVLR